MKIYYRISNNSYKKNRLSFATKEFCLNNFLSQFNINENNITIIADNVTEKDLLSFLTHTVKIPDYELPRRELKDAWVYVNPASALVYENEINNLYNEQLLNLSNYI